MSELQPSNTDAILGGQNLIPVDAAVLGGVAGKNRRLSHESGLSYELVNELSQTHDIFSFETVTVNDLGKIITRSTKQVFYYTENLGDGVMLDMVYIPAGSFMMGSSEGEEGNQKSEKPRHLVQIPAFHMGKYLITQEQYQIIMGKKSSKIEEDKLPIQKISWDDSQKFCEKVSQKVGRKYQLPSESQWEYACRAGTTTLFHFGDAITSEVANINPQKNGEKYSKAKHKKYRTIVGSFPANNFGLYDIPLFCHSR